MDLFLKERGVLREFGLDELRRQGEREQHADRNPQRGRRASHEEDSILTSHG